MNAPQAVALMGATGTGKTRLALELADAVPNLVAIACDSMQVYEGLDIGTAKPSAEERGRLPHRMLDVVRLPDICSAARWARMAAEAIEKERAQGRIPLIVGGTGLYLKALIEGLAEIPTERGEVRERLRARLAREGIVRLHEELRKVDPETARRLAPTDTQRILRALAVFESSGRPLSDWLNEGRRPLLPGGVRLFVLELPRAILRARIAERFHVMLEKGWLDEVRWLAGLNLPETHPAMRAVGYRQLLAHVRTGRDLELCIREGITATRRYAKRQATWFAHQTPQAERGDAGQLRPRLVRALSELGSG